MIARRAWRRIRRQYWQLMIPRYATIAGVRATGLIRYDGWPIIEVHPNSEVVLRNGVTLCSVSDLTALGVAHPVVLRTLCAESRIEVGENTGISGATICAAKLVTIGCDCLIGANVTITDTDFHPIRPQRRRFARIAEAAIDPVRIGDNVFLGMSSIVLKGVSIGDNSVIGAGSIVSKDIPANVIAAGNPARVLETLPPNR